MCLKAYQLTKKERERLANKEIMSGYEKNKDYILRNLDIDVNILEFADETLLADKEFMSRAIDINGHALKYASKDLKNDRDLVLKSINLTDGFSLQYASRKLKSDEDVVSCAIKKYKAPLKFASKKVQEKFKWYLDKR